MSARYRSLLIVDFVVLALFALSGNVTFDGTVQSLNGIALRQAIDRVQIAGWRVSELTPFGVELRCASLHGDRFCDFASLDADALKVLAWRHGHVVLEQVRSLNQTEMEHQASRIGDLLKWKFGYTFQVKPEKNFKTTVSSRGKTPIHFDGMFYTHVPRFQLFQCVIPPDDGGETTFIHTVPLTRDLGPGLVREMRDVSVDYFTPNLDYFGGQTTTFPLVRPHPFVQGANVLLWHEKHEGEVVQPVKRIVHSDRERQLLEIVDEHAFDERFVRYHRWNANQFLLADNIGQLHGRRPFGEETERLLWRIHIL